jgi:hypothetical protein
MPSGCDETGASTSTTGLASSTSCSAAICACSRFETDPSAADR